MTDEAARFRINRVAEATGISEATLRAWERRYQVPKPARTSSGYRLYSQEDLGQVRRMRALCEAGVSASDAAKEVLEQRHEPAPALPPPPVQEGRLLELVTPQHVNGAGVLALHRAVALMERAATAEAARSGRSDAIAVTCAAVDLRMPVRTGALVAATARMVASGEAAVLVDVELSTEDVHTGERQQVARATFTLVSAPTPPA